MPDFDSDGSDERVTETLSDADDDVDFDEVDEAEADWL